MAIATFVFVCFFHIKLLKERKNVRFITFLFGFSLTYLYLCKMQNLKIDRQSFWEIVRFGTVGTTSMLIHYGIYYLLLPLMDMNIAYSIGYFLSFLCNFLMSSYFTFKVKPSWKRSRHQLFCLSRTVQLLLLGGRSCRTGSPACLSYSSTHQFPAGAFCAEKEIKRTIT